MPALARRRCCSTSTRSSATSPRWPRFTKAAGINLRPHSKGAKSIEIARRQIAAGAIGICCSTLGEAEVIAGSGIEGVLITSPVVTPAMIERLIALNARAKGLMVAADNPANVDALAAASGKAGKPLSIIVEFDVGQGRTGTISVDAARRAGAPGQGIAASALCRRAGLLRPFPAHRGLCRSQGGRRRRRWRRVRDLLARLKAEGLAPGIVTGGGTGTFDIDPAGGVYTEIQPGSYPFMDREYRRDRHCRRAAHRRSTPSLFVQASVVSASRDGLRRRQCRLQVLRHRGRHADGRRSRGSPAPATS